MDFDPVLAKAAPWFAHFLSVSAFSLVKGVGCTRR